MPERDALAELAADFRALSARERRAVLGILSAGERSRLRALVDSVEQARDVRSEPAGRFDGFSPWLVARLRDAPEEGSVAPWRMTPAARQLLRQAVQDYRQETPAEAVAEHRAGSLLEALTSLFVPRPRTQ